jgi:hypothetical protein
VETQVLVPLRFRVEAGPFDVLLAGELAGAFSISHAWLVVAYALCVCVGAAVDLFARDDGIKPRKGAAWRALQEGAGLNSDYLLLDTLDVTLVNP